jgi:nucleotide-binding universal stress UspA family protein
MGKLVTLATYPYNRAQIAKMRLENEGIECVITNVNPIKGSFPSGAKLRVREEDIERAIPIITIINEEFAKARRQSELSKSKEELVFFAAFSFSRAQLIKGFLEAEGIECFMSNSNPISGALPGEVKISLRQEDLSVALQVLSRIETEEERGRPGKYVINDIAVAVDFTEYGVNAAKYALELAAEIGVGIRLFHCYYTPLIETTTLSDAYFESYVNIDKVQREIKETSEKKMETFVSDILTYRKKRKIEDVKITYDCVNGDPADQILGYVQENNLSLLVIGSSSHDRTTNRLFGSVTSYVAENATFPVMIIPPEATFSNGKGVKNVMYASRFDESDFVSVAKLMAVIQPLNANLHAIHLSNRGELVIDQARMDSFISYFKKLYPQYNISYHLVDITEAEADIDKYVQDKGIAVSSYTFHKQNIIGRFFNPDVQNKLLFHSKIPLLIFHG